MFTLIISLRGTPVIWNTIVFNHLKYYYMMCSYLKCTHIKDNQRQMIIWYEYVLSNSKNKKQYPVYT